VASVVERPALSLGRVELLRSSGTDRWDLRSLAVVDRLVVALYGAPRCSTLHGVWRERVDPMARAEAARRRGVVVVMAGASGPVESTIEVWIGADGRHLVATAGSVRLTSGDHVVRYVPGSAAIRESRAEQSRWAAPELWWRPRPLLGVLDIDGVVDGSVLGRPCWHVTARCDAGQFPGMLMVLAGDRVEMSVDQATGVVLAMREWFDDVEVSSGEWTLFEPDVVVDTDVFDRAIPADVAIRTQTEMLVEQARADRVDLTGVDLTDLGEVLQRMHPSPHPTEAILDQYVPTGEPPADLPAAAAAIGEAFASFATPDGDSLPFVEAGHGLAASVVEAASRHPGVEATMDVRRIKFLAADRAVVVYAIVTPDGQSLLSDSIGEAVLSEGRWRVARNTFAGLMRLAGVTVPPP
jgi:hypothetical protein